MHVTYMNCQWFNQLQSSQLRIDQYQSLCERIFTIPVEDLEDPLWIVYLIIVLLKT